MRLWQAALRLYQLGLFLAGMWWAAPEGFPHEFRGSSPFGMVLVGFAVLAAGTALQIYTTEAIRRLYWRFSKSSAAPAANGATTPDRRLY